MVSRYLHDVVSPEKRRLRQYSGNCKGGLEWPTGVDPAEVAWALALARGHLESSVEFKHGPKILTPKSECWVSLAGKQG